MIGEATASKSWGWLGLLLAILGGADSHRLGASDEKNWSKFPTDFGRDRRQQGGSPEITMWLAATDTAHPDCAAVQQTKQIFKTTALFGAPPIIGKNAGVLSKHTTGTRPLCLEAVARSGRGFHENDDFWRVEEEKI